jgi:hypothetical protein
VCFLALAQWRVLEQWMHGKGLGTCARKLIAEISTIKSMDIAIPVRRGEAQTELTIRTVARPERHVAELLVHLGLELPTRNRILAAPPDGKRRRNRANVVQKNRVHRPGTRINTESASANCGTWVSRGIAR